MFAMSHYWFFLTEHILLFLVVIRSTSSQFLAEPKDYCRLTPDRGPCEESQRRWYYDLKVDNCSQFVFGGCLGNQNNFDTFERCDLTCRRTRNSASTIGYMFASGIGPNLPDTQRRSSTALGVDDRGNTNVLLVADSTDECDQPIQRGFCSSFIPRWHHNGSSCELFYYSGCGGNGNNFMTRESCLERCPSRTVTPSLQTSSLRPLVTNLPGLSCQLRPQRGSCRSALIRWYYDVPSQACLEFVYSGCNGNENNHASEQECSQQCSREPTRRSGAGRSISTGKSDQNALFPGAFEQQSPDQFADAGVRPSEVIVRTRNGEPSVIPTGSLPEKCIPEPERGPCTVDIERWYHDVVTKSCRPFYYGGCLGNSNRFSTRKECENTCNISPPVRGITPTTDAQACVLEPATGPCRAAFTRYYFDVAGGQCKQFTYGGCDGNANNFASLEDCESRCQTIRPESFNGVRTSIGPSLQLNGVVGTGRSSRLGAKCFLPSETGPCRAALPKWFFNGRFCATFMYGGCAGNENNFDSAEQCQAACGGAVNLVPSLEPPSRLPVGGGRSDSSLEPGLLATDACAQPPDSGSCNGVIPRFFNDFVSGSCKPFTYGGCAGNLNNYKSHTECELTCQPRAPKVDKNASLPAVCGLPAERGPCRAFIPAFFHDVRDGKCKMFYFGGCQGNENRFSFRQECEDVCSGTSSILDLQNQIPREISTGVFGPTPTLSPETDSCNLPSAAGPCLAMIPSYFFDPDMQQCRQFIYGGCGGNSNRFATKDDCDNKCRPQMSARSAHNPTRKAVTHNSADCLSPTETGPCRGRFKVFGFDAAQQSCVEFVYGGCNGNGNRFPTREECNAQCAGLMVSDNANMMKMQQLRESPTPNFSFQPEQPRRIRN